MLYDLAVSIIAFISTNIDDFAVLMVLYAGAQSIKSRLQITAGQFTGIALITAASAAAAAGLGLLPHDRISVICRLLGFVPVALGIKKIIGCRKKDEEEERPSCTGYISAAAITLADGGDNLGVYIPVFAAGGTAGIAVSCIVFFVLTAAWCVAAFRLAGTQAVQDAIRRYGHIIVPTVYLMIGLSVLFGIA